MNSPSENLEPPTELDDEFDASIEGLVRQLVPGDPFGDAVFLWILYRNDIQGPLREQLVDSTTSFVKTILIEKDISRYEDREITAASLAYGVLGRLGLDFGILPQTLDELLSPRFDLRQGFFDNVLYTAAIAIGVSMANVTLRVEDGVLSFLAGRAEALSDPREGFFVGEAFRLLADRSSATKHAKAAVETLRSENRRFDDQLFLALTAWSAVDYLSPMERKQVRERLVALIRGYGEFLFGLQELKLPAEFGEPGAYSPSRMLVAALFELRAILHRDLVVLSKDELREESATRLGFYWGFAAIACSFAAAGLVVFGRTLPGLSTAGMTGSNAVAVAMNLGAVFGAVTGAVSAASIFWDIGIAGSVSRITRQNLKRRLREHVLGLVIIPTVIGTFLQLLLR